MCLRASQRITYSLSNGEGSKARLTDTEGEQRGRDHCNSKLNVENDEMQTNRFQPRILLQKSMNNK